MASTAALELVVNLKDNASKGMDTIAEKGGGLGKLLKGIAGPAALLTGGVGALGAGLFAAGNAAAEEEVGMKRLQQTLKNSVEGYDDANGAVEDYIGQQEKLAFADDELRDSLAHLVGQTGDLGEAQRLQATAMDLARAKGISLEAATKAVGKVDQESIGILKKLGIQVTESMTKEEALAAIRATSAGQADAYAKSAAGSMEIVQNSFGNAVEDIGGVVLPALTSIIGGVAEFAGVVSNAFKTGDFSKIGEMVAGALGGVIKWVGDMVPDLIEKIGEWAGAFIEWVGPMIPEWIKEAGEFIGDVLKWLGDQVPKVIEEMVKWAKAFIEWVGPMIPKALTELGKFLGAAITWIANQVPGIVTKLGEWVGAFLGWILPMIPPALEALGKFAVAALKWLGDQIPTIVSKLLEWAAAFLGWIVPMIPPMLLELGKLLLSVTGWIVTEALPALILQLAQWAGAFLGWIGGVVLSLPAKLGEVAEAIWPWIATTAKGIGTAILQFAGGFWTWIIEVLKWIPDKLAEIGAAIWKWIGETAKNVVDVAAGIGKAILDGIMSGLGGAAKAIGDFLMEIAKAVWEAVVGFFTGEARTVLDMAANPSGKPSGKAHGGPVWAGQQYMVGERGPELFMPSRSGTIVPNNRLGGAGGRTNITVNVNNPPLGMNGRALGAEVAAAISAELGLNDRVIHRGGLA